MEDRVNQEVQRHEKVRFRQDDITCLTKFPSAEGQEHLLTRRPASARILRGVRVGAAIAGGVLAAVILVVLFIGFSGLGTERLRREAEVAIQRVAGVDVAATIGPANLSLDSSRFLALEVQDVKFSSPADGLAMLNAGSVRFGVRFWPLVSGRVRLGSATISDAQIIADALPTREGPDWKASLLNADGLIDPDRLAAALLGGLHRAFDTMGLGLTRFIELENVEFVLPEGGRMRNIFIADARLHQVADGELSITAQVEIDSRTLSLDGTAKRDTVSRRISSLDLHLTAPADNVVGEAGTAEQGGAGGSRIGAVEIRITGREGMGGEPSRLSATIGLMQSELGLGSRGKLAGDVEIAALLTTGSGKVEIERLHAVTGRSQFDFQGAIGPAPRTDSTQPASYRYELVSRKSTVAPSDSPEPGLEFAARISGNYDPATSRLSANELGIRTGSGELTGEASLEFAAGKAPGISLVLNVPSMSVGHLKQLWPWFAAGGPRRWVMNNLFGGKIVDSRLQYQVPVGRIGNGVPLSHDEVFGKFKIEDTRFDVAGRIPPVRDAFGSVDFRGNDIDIALSSGTLFMASGRKVAASNGTLVVRNANRRPVIGDLDVDISGDADAVAELASYEPIDAMRHVGLKSEEFSGKVEGHVKAQIPLQKGIDVKSLDWLVSLKYRDLAITKPFDGQTVTAAQGTIIVDPQKALIDAKARLNGAPATIALVEPLNERGPERQRTVEVVLDDKAREALVPGLGSMLSGPVTVDFSSRPGEPQEISADLTDAKLTIPWAGWSKGAGVPAAVSFLLEKSEDTAKLSKFKLSGKSFQVEGDISLAKGELSSARFNTVKLNRGDDISLVMERSGKGYEIEINGNALDARAVIKQFTADTQEAAETAGSVPISIKAKVDRLNGFHEEQLSNVRLNYRGVGATVLGMDVSAKTKSGAPVSLTNSTKGGRRTMDMESPDAGAILRFMDIYEHMQGGRIKLALAGSADGPLKGHVDATNFWVVNEPKLRSIVSTAPTGDGRSLNEAVKRDIDTSSVQFERGYAEIEKGSGYLSLASGVLRGPMIGTTFQGTLYDTRGQMAMTGTFMPAYGLNRLFGELPLVGMILGNGRDRGLIGVTYKLSGEAKSPELQINPLSVIAPGIFRSIFEYR